jgi:hypothetical protein
LNASLHEGPASQEDRLSHLRELGEIASNYRQSVYHAGTLSSPVTYELDDIRSMLDNALAVIDHSIDANLSPDGLYHAYNLLIADDRSLDIEHLYTMLEGQVAALSSGAIKPADAIGILENLFEGDLYLARQKTFLLYPDRDLPRYLQKAVIPEHRAKQLPVIGQMLARSDHRLVERDADGTYRFNPALTNAQVLRDTIRELENDYGEHLSESVTALDDLYEQVFNHHSFTGRAGGMFAFEGLGSIYWHMVSKLLLAVQELFFVARDQDDDPSVQQRLGNLYYRVREGIGFNKTPREYGAFPTDPYSHTPGHMGAQQPGMTGQVKEEIVARFGELGLRIKDGTVYFDPGLLRAQEFTAEPASFRFLGVDNEWDELALPAQSLAFTWCQVPVIYRLDDGAPPGLVVHRQSGDSRRLPDLRLPQELSGEISLRSGQITRLELSIPTGHLSRGEPGRRMRPSITASG